MTFEIQYFQVASGIITWNIEALLFMQMPLIVAMCNLPLFAICFWVQLGFGCHSASLEGFFGGSGVTVLHLSHLRVPLGRVSLLTYNTMFTPPCWWLWSSLVLLVDAGVAGVPSDYIPAQWVGLSCTRRAWCFLFSPRLYDPDVASTLLLTERRREVPELFRWAAKTIPAMCSACADVNNDVVGQCHPVQNPLYAAKGGVAWFMS